MSNTQKQISIKFDKDSEYQQIIELRNNFRKRLNMPKLSLRETIMILVNRELE